MVANSNVPIIIKRKKVVSGDGHHGGAWKVAYADFVTAMMAFFMLMWLLNATTENQRKGIADYFSPTIPISRISGGGDGAFGGESVLSKDLLPEVGNLPQPSQAQAQLLGAEQDEISFNQVMEALTALSGESAVIDRILRHVITRVTDEGLIIELFDLEDQPLFIDASDVPTGVMQDLTAMIAQIVGFVSNDLAVEGHVRSQPIVLLKNQNWEISHSRAQAIRLLLQQNGAYPQQMNRVTAHGDREPQYKNPLSVRNNRIEIIVLRSGEGKSF